MVEFCERDHSLSLQHDASECRLHVREEVQPRDRRIARHLELVEGDHDRKEGIQVARGQTGMADAQIRQLRHLAETADESLDRNLLLARDEQMFDLVASIHQRLHIGQGEQLTERGQRRRELENRILQVATDQVGGLFIQLRW
jgi:hypothetical protein